MRARSQFFGISTARIRHRLRCNIHRSAGSAAADEARERWRASKRRKVAHNRKLTKHITIVTDPHLCVTSVGCA